MWSAEEHSKLATDEDPATVVWFQRTSAFKLMGFFSHCSYTLSCTVSLAWLKSTEKLYSSKEMSILSDSRNYWLAITKNLLITEVYALAAISRIKYPQGIWLKMSIEVWQTACKNISSVSCSTTVHYV